MYVMKLLPTPERLRKAPSWEKAEILVSLTLSKHGVGIYQLTDTRGAKTLIKPVPGDRLAYQKGVMVVLEVKYSQKRIVKIRSAGSSDQRRRNQDWLDQGMPICYAVVNPELTEAYLYTAPETSAILLGGHQDVAGIPWNGDLKCLLG